MNGEQRLKKEEKQDNECLGQRLGMFKVDLRRQLGAGAEQASEYPG